MPDDIVITFGCTVALNLCLRAVTRPAGGTVLWVEFPAGIDSVDLYRKALEK